MKHKKDAPWTKLPTTPTRSAGTGPVTAEGKAISSKNALTHGCSSTGTLILPSENAQDFEALKATWFLCYRPKDEAETHLIQQLIESDWFFKRATRAYADKEARLYAETPNSAEWTEEQHKSLGRFLRYRTTHMNTVAKLRKAVEDYRRKRQLEQARDQAAHHKEERLALAKARVEIMARKRSHTVEQELHKWLNADRAHLESSSGERSAAAQTAP